MPAKLVNKTRFPSTNNKEINTFAPDLEYEKNL